MFRVSAFLKCLRQDCNSQKGNVGFEFGFWHKINPRVLYCIEIFLGFEIIPKDLVCQEHLKFLVLEFMAFEKKLFLRCSYRVLRFFFLL
jgi:hypothetical protein